MSYSIKYKLLIIFLKKNSESVNQDFKGFQETKKNKKKILLAT